MATFPEAETTPLAGRAALLEAQKAPDRSKESNADAGYLARAIAAAVRARREAESKGGEPPSDGQNALDPPGGEH